MQKQAVSIQTQIPLGELSSHAEFGIAAFDSECSDYSDEVWAAYEQRHPHLLLKLYELVE